MSINNVKWDYEIVDGPSRDRIFDACKYAYDEDHIKINFKIAICYDPSKTDPFRVALPMYITDVLITKVKHKDSSGLKFDLTGSCRADLNLKETVTALNYREYDIKSYNHKYCRKVYAGMEDLKPYNFVAYYNTSDRRGQITFSEFPFSE